MNIESKAAEVAEKKRRQRHRKFTLIMVLITAVGCFLLGYNWDKVRPKLVALLKQGFDGGKEKLTTAWDDYSPELTVKASELAELIKQKAPEAADSIAMMLKKRA